MSHEAARRNWKTWVNTAVVAAVVGSVITILGSQWTTDKQIAAQREAGWRAAHAERLRQHKIDVDRWQKRVGECGEEATTYEDRASTFLLETEPGSQLSEEGKKELFSRLTIVNVLIHSDPPAHFPRYLKKALHLCWEPLVMLESIQRTLFQFHREQLWPEDTVFLMIHGQTFTEPPDSAALLKLMKPIWAESGRALSLLSDALRLYQVYLDDQLALLSEGPELSEALRASYQHEMQRLLEKLAHNGFDVPENIIGDPSDQGLSKIEAIEEDRRENPRSPPVSAH